MSTSIPMHDPQNLDDVLSAIRKLVSEETGAARQAGGAGNRLVLTQDLKVREAQGEPLRLETPVAIEAKAENAGQPAPFHDEVALRALVAEMIREELQGELGARITRNVRKLIKREIEDALSARDRV